MTVASTPHLRRLGLVLTITSLAAIAYATLLPEPGQSLQSHFCLICGPLGGVDAILNVLLFVPLGVALALCGIPTRRALLTMTVFSVLIETAQLLLIPGRDATIGDVVTNTLGGALGFAASRYIPILLRPSPRIASSLVIAWGAIWLAIQTVSSFALVPSIPESQYYGQLARSLGKLAVFQGRVLAASVDNIVIPNTVIADSREVRRQLLEGATVATWVVPAGPTPDIAPIVRVADSEQSEILLLAQDGVDLLFAIHSGAAVLRLRPPVFALPRVFPTGVVAADVKASDALGLSGRYLSREVRLNAKTRAATNGNRVPLTASLAWTLVLPSQWFIEGTRAEVVISLIWIVVLIVPFGYWTSQLANPRRAVGFQERPTLFWIGTLVILGVGLGLAPRAFGLSPTPVREWLGGAAGLLLGAGLAARLPANAEPITNALG
jgi:hypothetical protein